MTEYDPSPQGQARAYQHYLALKERCSHWAQDASGHVEEYKDVSDPFAVRSDVDVSSFYHLRPDEDDDLEGSLGVPEHEREEMARDMGMSMPEWQSTSRKSHRRHEGNLDRSMSLNAHYNYGGEQRGMSRSRRTAPTPLTAAAVAPPAPGQVLPGPMPVSGGSGSRESRGSRGSTGFATYGPRPGAVVPSYPAYGRKPDPFYDEGPAIPVTHEPSPTKPSAGNKLLGFFRRSRSSSRGQPPPPLAIPHRPKSRSEEHLPKERLSGSSYYHPHTTEGFVRESRHDGIYPRRSEPEPSRPYWSTRERVVREPKPYGQERYESQALEEEIVYPRNSESHSRRIKPSRKRSSSLPPLSNLAIRDNMATPVPPQSAQPYGQQALISSHRHRPSRHEYRAETPAIMPPTNSHSVPQHGPAIPRERTPPPPLPPKDNAPGKHYSNDHHHHRRSRSKPPTPQPQSQYQIYSPQAMSPTASVPQHHSKYPYYPTMAATPAPRIAHTPVPGISQPYGRSQNYYYNAPTPAPVAVGPYYSR